MLRSIFDVVTDGALFICEARADLSLLFFVALKCVRSYCSHFACGEYRQNHPTQASISQAGGTDASSCGFVRLGNGTDLVIFASLFPFASFLDAIIRTDISLASFSADDSRGSR